MELFLPILVSLVQLAVLGGVVFLIVRQVSKRDREPSEGGGVAIRRFFLYSLMLGTLVLSGIGFAGLLSAAVSAASRITQDSTAVARSLAFILVGGPVFAGLARYTERRLADDPREQRSFGWSFYLTVALVGSLIAVMSLTGAVLSELLDEARFDRSLLIHLVVWSAVWVGHWLVAQRREPALGRSVHLLLGSAAGLIATSIGSAGLVIAALRQVYDMIWLDTVVGGGVEDLVRPLIVVAIGTPVWWWYWFRHGRGVDRTPLWVAYVLLLGVLGGVIAVISGAGVMLFGVLQWFIGDPSASSAASHFTFIPGSLGTVVAGGAVWAYHAGVLGSRARRARIEVDRIYDYLLAGAGLIVAASGVVTIIAVALSAVGGGDITSSSGDAVAAALTLLGIGVPLWWRYWAMILASRRSDPDGELRSSMRRVYIFVLFGVAAVVAVISLIVVLFVTFEDLLDGSLGRRTIGSISVPFGLLVTAGAAAWYHFAVFREDRADVPEEERSTLREVIVVGPEGDPLESLIGDRTHAEIRLLRSSSAPINVESLDELMDRLSGQPHERVIVVARGDGRYDLVILED